MATANHVRIAYDDTGGGEPAVVLIHGLFEDRTYYAAQVDHLAKRHRVINVDLRGHGESDRPETGYSLDALTGDVLDVCDEAGVQRAVFCGHSLALALKAAIRRPELAAGVVLLDGAVLMPPMAAEMMGKLEAALQTEGWREALLGFFSHEAAGAADRVRADISTAPRVYAAPLLADILAANDGVHVDELRALRCPLMYVHSQIPIDLDRLRSLRPDVLIEEIPGAGHYQMLTAADRVNELLDSFLAAVA